MSDPIFFVLLGCIGLCFGILAGAACMRQRRRMRRRECERTCGLQQAKFEMAAWAQKGSHAAESDTLGQFVASIVRHTEEFGSPDELPALEAAAAALRDTHVTRDDLLAAPLADLRWLSNDNPVAFEGLQVLQQYCVAHAKARGCDNVGEDQPLRSALKKKKEEEEEEKVEVAIDT